ncbi:MAG: hypothetical protein ACYC6M_05000 [Terriglobales bacterium]
MAKLTPRTARADYLGPHPKMRKAGSIGVARVRGADRKGDLFAACVFLGGKAFSKEPAICGRGHNPRVALAKALKSASSRVEQRRGAFAGTGRRRKRRRE